MPKIATGYYYRPHSDEWVSFRYDINCNAEGEFTTTLPAEIAGQMVEDGLELHTNGKANGRKGYLKADSKKGLEKLVHETVTNWKSKEPVGEKIYLEYVLQSDAAFCFDKERGVVPNGAWVEDWDRSEGWLGGTEGINSPGRGRDVPGIDFYVNPIVETTYRFVHSGKEFVEVRRYKRDDHTGGYSDDPLDFLEGMRLGGIPNGSRLRVEKLEYTPELGRWFVNFYKGLCLLAKQVADLAGTGEKILELAGNGGNLLGPGDG